MCRLMDAPTRPVTPVPRGTGVTTAPREVDEVAGAAAGHPVGTAAARERVGSTSPSATTSWRSGPDDHAFVAVAAARPVRRRWSGTPGAGRGSGQVGTAVDRGGPIAGA